MTDKKMTRAEAGALGGRKSSGGPLKGNPELAKELGRKGALARTTESRKLAAKKAWETKRKKMEG